MKKFILIIAILFGFSFNSQAQDIKFGVKGGLNFANINLDNDVDAEFDSRTGYHIGLVTQFSMLGMFALQPELLYSAQGAKDIDLDYLNVPVLFKYKIAGIASIEAGPQFGFLVNDNVPDIFDSSLNDFDISGAVGAGVEISKFFAQLRYNFGFSDAFDGGDSKNSNFQVSVGYYIF